MFVIQCITTGIGDFTEAGSDSMPGLSVVGSNSRQSLINEVMSAPSATMRK